MLRDRPSVHCSSPAREGDDLNLSGDSKNEGGYAQKPFQRQSQIRLVEEALDVGSKDKEQNQG